PDALAQAGRSHADDARHLVRREANDLRQRRVGDDDAVDAGGIGGLPRRAAARALRGRLGPAPRVRLAPRLGIADLGLAGPPLLVLALQPCLQLIPCRPRTRCGAAPLSGP